MLRWGQVNTESGGGVKSLMPGFRESCVDKFMFPSIYFLSGIFVSLLLHLGT